MTQITLWIPEESLLALKWFSEAQAAQALRMAAAVKLFELGQLSSGAAAKLANVPKTVFLSKLADYGIDTFTLTKADLEEEVRFA